MILITGATGRVGSALVDLLVREGERPRLFVRSARARTWPARVEVAAGDFTRPETFAPALRGVTAIYLMNRGLTAESLRSFLEQARRQRAGRIAFLSSMAASDARLAIGRMHQEQEDAIAASGIPAHFLRCQAFMSNALDWIESIRAAGIVPNPLGDAPYAPIAPEDIAAVAARALAGAHAGPPVLELTGPELISLPQQVEVLAEVLRRPLRAVEITRADAIAGMERAGIPTPVAAAIADHLESVRRGEGARLTRTVETVLGHPPRPFRTWAIENRSRFPG